MNFQGLSKIEDVPKYLEYAQNRADARADMARGKGQASDRLIKSRNIELARLQTFGDYLTDVLFRILKSFPAVDNLPEFYVELIRTTLDYDQLKKSLGALNWGTIMLRKFTRMYAGRMLKCPDVKRINVIRREYFGRAASVMYQIKKEMRYLEEARKVMQGYPSVKTKMPTIAIAGFPNVGKSTLLAKLSGSVPNINEYPFTTKGINVGYINARYDKVQLLDTPGTLNRPDRMNDIERIAYLAMKYLAWEIIYVFDPLEEYPIKDQLRLFEMITDFDKPLIVFVSKTDCISDKEFQEFKEKLPKTRIISNTDELRKFVEAKIYD